jgi:hypothetical protein
MEPELFAWLTAALPRREYGGPLGLLAWTPLCAEGEFGE